MDLSSWIFVALAVAWAVYLVPKALQHHEDVVRSRSVDRFSHTMRVLARREPVSTRNARLVVQPGRSTSAPVVTSKATHAPSAPEHAAAALSPAQLRARRDAANAAARRRRRVLSAILMINAVVIGLAAFAVVPWLSVAAPVALLVAWLVACRLMVRREQGVASPSRRLPLEPEEEDEETAPEKAPADPVAGMAMPVTMPVTMPVNMDDTSEMAAARIDPTLWDPVPVTLPTYVTKPAATRRTVRTINLDDSGVWTSGRTDADYAIAREAEEADKAARARQAEGDDHRAVGS